MCMASCRRNFTKPTDLPGWISKIRRKKANFKCQKRRNLRTEAILAYALGRAQNDLRHRQQERKIKWQKMMEAHACLPQNDDKVETSDAQLFEDIHAEIDEFMNKLKTCKETPSAS